MSNGAERERKEGRTFSLLPEWKRMETLSCLFRVRGLSAVDETGIVRP